MPETAVVTLLFCDLVGSTELLTSLGDDANDEVRRSLLAALGRAADAYGGEVVKSAGDGVMVSFRRSAADAVACGMAMQRAAAQIEHDGAPLGLELRVGISSGEASHESGDWFGTPVVEAARLEAAARPGQILVSEVVRTIVGTRGGAQFRDAGKRDFKGFPRAVPVIEVVWRTEDDPKPQPRRKSRKRRSRAIIAGLVVGAAAAAAIAAAILLTRDSGTTEAPVADGLALVAEGYMPVLEGETCDPEWQIGADVTCEELIVPENRDAPGGRQVRIEVLTYPPRGATGNPPTITIGGFDDNFEESDVRRYGEFVSFFIRGGSSLHCPEVVAVQRAVLGLPHDEADQVWLEAHDRCGQRLQAEGHDLNQYGVEDMATDLRDLVIAKGWPRVNLQANGEWSRIAIRFAQLYPQTVNAVIIADPLPFYAPQDDLIIRANAALETYFEKCVADEDCIRAFPTVAERPAALLARFEQDPVIVDVADPAGGADIPVYVDGEVLIWTLAQALGDTSALPIIAATLSADEDALLRTAASYLVSTISFAADDPWGVWNSEYCEDVGPLVSRSAIEASAATYPLFAPMARPNEICDHWPTEPDSVLSREVKVSQAPALIMNGELSPWFPPEYADNAGSAFADPRLMTFPNVSGGAIGSGHACILDLRLAFLRDPRGDLDSQACADSIPPIAFEGT